MTYKYIITQSLAMLMSLASNAFEVKSGQPVVVSADTARMEPVAKTALKMLKGDIRKVLGSEMNLVNTSVNSSCFMAILLYFLIFKRTTSTAVLLFQLLPLVEVFIV